MCHYLDIALGLVMLTATTTPAFGQASEPAGVTVERRLEELLTPGGNAGPAPGSVPVAWPAGKAVEPLGLAPIAVKIVPPRPPVAAGKQRVPRSVKEGRGPIVAVVLPARSEMPTEALVQMPAVNVDRPLPLPILAQPKSDRAAIDDVTLEGSRAAAVARVRPRRRDPVAFAPVNLPDPFENQRNGAVRFPPNENEQPPAVPIRTPVR